MNFTDFTRSTQHLRSDLARSRPRAFFFHEASRLAAGAALVIMISEATPWPFQYGSPELRLWFVVSWSALMAGWSLWRLRSKKNTPAPSLPRVQ